MQICTHLSTVQEIEPLKSISELGLVNKKPWFEKAPVKRQEPHLPAFTPSP